MEHSKLSSEQQSIKHAVRKSLKRRKVSEIIFRLFGIGAVAVAISAVIFLLSSLIHDGVGAFRQTHLALDISFPQMIDVKLLQIADIDEDGHYRTDDRGNLIFNPGRVALADIAHEKIDKTTARYDLTSLSKHEYPLVVSSSMEDQYQELIYQGLAKAIDVESIKGRKYRDLRRFMGLGAIQKLRKELLDNPDYVGSTVTMELPVSSVLDYWWRHGGADVATILKDIDSQSQQAQNIKDPQERRQALKTLSIAKAQALKGLKQQQVAWADGLYKKDLLDVKFTARILTNIDSSEADAAGLKGALIGTAYTMLVTLIISFVFGVSAAVWLEQFAPQGRFSDFIEVNINNLAAVPSIVKGLLGLAVFQQLMGIKAGTPLLGGLVLSLIAMPTIIVASRAAIKSVPPSLKQGALGVGASDMQSVFHHVIPAALPGMLTGTIIGLAQALGETAPLLMIGMRGFSPTPPEGLNDATTTIAATIYNWFSLGKDSFNELASAAILVLLLFLLLMNALAVYLRKKFELDW